MAEQSRICRRVLQRSSKLKKCVLQKPARGIDEVEACVRAYSYANHGAGVAPAQRIFKLTHSSRLAGLRWRNRMFYTLSCSCCRSHMAVKIAAIVLNCHSCARSREKLREHLNQLKVLPTSPPPEAVAIGILGHLPRTQFGN